jgi:hypothetical protein
MLGQMFDGHDTAIANQYCELFERRIDLNINPQA